MYASFVTARLYPRRQLLLLLALPLAACDCGDGGLQSVPDGGMVMARCVKDEDCPARNACNVSIGVCYPKDACDASRPCTDPNQMCTDVDGDGFNECAFKRCTENSECSTIQCPTDKVPTCSAGGCICGDPCQGGCPSDQGCCVPEDTCHDLPPRCMGMTCRPGQFLSITATGAWDTGQCNVLGETCRCERLPPLPLGDVGLYSALAYDGRSAVLSAYNLDYGDLMYGVVQPDGVSVNWTFVDGVPTSTDTVTGDVDGPRGGNSGAGPDVGLYTDMAVDNAGRVHIAYQDRTLGDLKYAVLTPTGWRLHPLATDGDTGLYSSLTMDSAGRPRLAFLGAREDAGGQGLRKSTLRLAVTSTSLPTAASDWIIREIEVLSLTPYGCEEQCRRDEVCRATDLRCVVPDPPRNCPGACAADERCIMGRCSLVDQLSPFRDVPIARGVWPAIQMMPDGGVLIAFHDRVDKNLKLARVLGPNPASGAISITVIDGQGAGSMDEVGLFPALVVTPGGEIHLTYQNATQRTLVYRLLNSALAVQIDEVVENGLDAMNGPDGHFVGADPAMVIDANGIVRIAYQDGTSGELRYARRMPGGSWVKATLKGAEMPYAGSFGFYSDQILTPDRMGALISTYRYFLSAPNGPLNGIELVTPP